MQTCKKCGGQVKADDEFCPSCGGKITGGGASASQPVRNGFGELVRNIFGGRAGTKARLIAIVGIVLVVVFFIIVAFGVMAGITSTATPPASQGNQSGQSAVIQRQAAQTRNRRTQSNPAGTTVVQPTAPTVSNEPAQQPTACTSNWQCGDWNTCTGNGTGGGQQTRSCSDSNYCGTPVGEPPTEQSCSCVPNWQCSIWNPCPTPPYPGAPLPSGGNVATRSCTDENRCGTSAGEPPTTQSCGQN